MRLDLFHLWRYGKFTDHTIDFGQPQANKPDLHIIYGPNEAGKTTLMSAYLDFLFGIPLKTTYNFKHANSALKVGGVITADKKSVEFIRLKKNKNSFVDADEQPADESLLRQHLAGLGKKSYQSMFSLNDDTLEEGGESILASEGDLGKLLYSATTGVAQLSDALSQMREESELFYKKGKRNFELADLKNKLKQINNERKSIDIEANAYSKLSNKRSDAIATYESLATEHDRIKLQIRKLELRRSAYPRLVSIKRLQAVMLPLKDLPDTPTNWIDEVKQLQIDSIKTETIATDFIEKISSINKAITPIVLDQATLTAIHSWKQIEQEHSNFHVASTNLPDLEQQLRLCKIDIEGHLHKLGQADIDNPRSLILDATNHSSIKELIKQHPELLSQLNAATKELNVATIQHKDNQTRFSQSSGNPDSPSSPDATSHDNAVFKELELTIAPFSNNELAANYQTTLHKKSALQDELSEITSALNPWRGNVDTLLLLTIPHASELKSLQRMRDDIKDRTKSETISLRTLENNLADLRSQQKSYTATGLIDDVESHHLRNEREAAWNKHKKALDSHTAQIFEQTMRLDDAGQAARLQYTESLAKLEQLSRDIVVVEESISNSQTKLELMAKEQAHFKSEFSQFKKNLSPLLSPSMSIEAISTWIDTHGRAVRVLHQLKSVERELDGINSVVSKACERISKHLKLAGGLENKVNGYNHPIDKLIDLIKSANSILKQRNAQTGLRDQLTTSQQQLDTRNRELEDAQQTLDKWTLDWQSACKRCWLGTSSTLPTAIIADEFLQQLAPLEKQLTQQSRLQEKIAQQQQIIESYSRTLRSHANSLSIASEDLSPDQLYQALLIHVEDATALQTSQSDKQTQKNALINEQKANQAQQTIIQASIAAKSQYFSVSSIDDIQLKMQEVEKKHELQQRIDNEQSELLELLEVNTLSDALDFFSDYDADKTQLELDKLDRAAADLDLALREAHTAQQDAHRALINVGGDDAVALLNEKRANLLLEIEEKVTRFLQQHLALNAADAALKVYRDNHRSSMIKKASETFAHISQGRYIRLDTFQDGASEQLIAIEKDGGSRVSSELSKGTRFQLYLALRIAGYHEYARSHPAVPFIADDILETFDDERAHQTFEVLADMASAGQVIYLTHHQHLCDIAKRAVPECTLHQLPL